MTHYEKIAIIAADASGRTVEANARSNGGAEGGWVDIKFLPAAQEFNFSEFDHRVPETKNSGACSLESAF